MHPSPHPPRRRRLDPLLAAALATLLLTPVLAPAPGAAQTDGVPRELLTVAEASDFRATSRYEELLELLRRLEARAPEIMKLDFYGTSGQRRPLPVVVVSAAGAFTPEAVAASESAAAKPVVMIQNGIHGGEIDGKDACTMILREIALGRHRDILDGVTLLVLPVYNVDGHERVSRHNRANQNGPVEGMGFRTTAHGLDLNRDHLKIASREARALMRLVSAWRPHLHVDDHVTDGSDHAWTLTWSWAEAPQLAAPVDAWMDAHMRPVLAATEAAGHRVGPYVGLKDRANPARGFSSRIIEPRYATGYWPLRNRPSILVEMHAYKPYRERVLANRAFLVALLREVARSGGELVAAVEAAEQATVARGRPDAPPSEVVLTWEEREEPDRVRWPVYPWGFEPSVVFDRQVLFYRTTPEAAHHGMGDPEREAFAPESWPPAVEVDWWHRSVPGETVSRPRGYLVLPGWPQIEARLAGHGLEAERLTEAVELPVEEVRLREPEFAATPYQGQMRVESVTVERRRKLRRVPAGALWVPADQPDFEVAVQLLEPEAPDSLLAWGLLNTVFERKEYIEPRNLEPLAREMMDDPEVAAAWEEALAEEAFAADPRARYLWWYRRTPYWDDTVGRLPVYRVLEAVALPTAPWPSSSPAEQRLDGHHGEDGERRGGGHAVGRGLLQGVGEELGEGHPEHRPGGEAEAEGQGRLHLLDEPVGGQRQQRLGQAREDAPAGGAPHRHPLGDQHQADGRPLGDVVDGDGGGHEEPEGLPAPERHADADPLGGRVQRHHPDDQQGLEGRAAPQAAEGELLVAVALAEPAAAQDQEGEPQGAPDDGQQHAAFDPFEDQVEAGGDHQPPGGGVGQPDDALGDLPEEDEGQGPEAGGQCGEGGVEEDGEHGDVHRVSSLPVDSRGSLRGRRCRG